MIWFVSFRRRIREKRCAGTQGVDISLASTRAVCVAVIPLPDPREALPVYLFETRDICATPRRRSHEVALHGHSHLHRGFDPRRIDQFQELIPRTVAPIARNPHLASTFGQRIQASCPREHHDASATTVRSGLHYLSTGFDALRRSITAGARYLLFGAVRRAIQRKPLQVAHRLSSCVCSDVSISETTASSRRNAAGDEPSPAGALPDGSSRGPA
jgi:hypothetical protein